MNIRPILSIAVVLFFATMFASCTKVEMEAPSVKGGAEIRFGAMNELSSKPKTKSPADFDSRVVVAQDPAESRSFGLDVAVSDGIEMPRSGAPLTKGTQVVGINAFDVAAFFYADASSQDGSLLFTETVTDGYTENTYYWPSFGVMNFVALYPTGILGVGNYDNRGNGIQTIADDSGRLQSFSYEIPSAVEQHQDVMVAVTKGVNNAETGEAVPMNFKHLLSAVRFKVGKMLATRINTLTISGVKGGVVTISYNSENDRWEYEPSSDNVSYSPIYSVDGVPNIDTYGLAEGNYITSNDNGMVMFVMPQTLSGAKIHINYTELITGTTHDVNTTLAEHSWVAGQTNTYVININAETLQITIPTPPDADAHYVRVDMKYDLSGLNNYSGITISNVTAAAQWLNDGSNNASADKQAIYMKTTLTEMQKNGYFTDEEWQLAYSVDSEGKKTYTKGSAAGPERTNTNILGTETLTLTSGSKGTIYLFLDENDGHTDRNGELKLTATVTQNGISREVTLGSGKFKQLCPSWNQNNIGVERFEDGEDDIYPYGFSYNRTVTYENPRAVWFEDVFTNGSLLEQLGAVIYYLILWFTGSLAESVLPDSEGIAEGFVTVTRYNNFIKTVVLDYSKLNSVQAIASMDNGIQNTNALYNYTGQTDIADFENQIDKSFGTPSEGGEGQNWTKRIDVAGSNPTDYAAFIALTRNRMRELITTISGQGSNTTRNAVLHREGEGGTDGKGNETGSAIIEWYLPSAVEAQSLVETGTGLEATPISPLDGTYWSSTAGADPASGTNGYAYSYTYSRNTYTGNNSSEDRTTNRKVRAVRKKPTAN